MARCEVVQIQCDRCKRTELRTPSPPKVVSDIEIQYLGRRIVFPDLCETCKETVGRLVELAQEWQRELRQPFGPTVHSNEAPPLQTTPKYTPAQPHAASAKR